MISTDKKNKVLLCFSELLDQNYFCSFKMQWLKIFCKQNGPPPLENFFSNGKKNLFFTSLMGFALLMLALTATTNVTGKGQGTYQLLESNEAGPELSSLFP